MLLVGSLTPAPAFSAVIVQRPRMRSLLDEIKVDLAFVRSYTLQPKWYKTLKVAPGRLPG
jgi:hypothetical protein